MGGHAMLGFVMGGESDLLDRETAIGLLGWWLEAGVDSLVAEEPRDWLKPRQPATEAPVRDAPADRPAEISAPGARPETLDAFHSWLRETSDLPLFHAGASRALPHGPANAEVMLISDLPTRECAAEGRPIGGEAWQLTVRMLAAIGFKPDQAYVASLACFPAPGQRIDIAIAERCAETMREHVALVAPKRLLLLGDGPARALLGEAVLQARGRVHRIGGIPAVATLHPRQLLQRPSDKAHAWRDLLMLMNEEI